MSLIDERQDFSDIADVFLLHGSMQSPAFLDGRLCGLLALRDVTAEAWLEEVCISLGVEQPRDPASAERLLGWRRQTLEALSASDLNYAPLLPDELFSLAEQAQGLKEWTLGFMEEDEVADDTPGALVANAEKAIDDLEGLGGWRPISTIARKTNDLFAFEHARMAAMLLTPNSTRVSR